MPFKINWKIVGPAIAVVILIGFVVVSRRDDEGRIEPPREDSKNELSIPVPDKTSQPSGTKTLPPAPRSQLPSRLPQASGNVDDVVSSLLLESQDGRADFALEEGDATYITFDGQAMDGIGQAYDENSF